MKYGNVFTTSDYVNALMKSNRTQNGLKTWSQMYASTDLAAQQAESALKQNYAQEVAKAYSSAEQQKSIVYGSNLSQGYKNAAVDDVDLALNEAYETYRSNYLSSLQEIDAEKMQAQQQISSLLHKQAENTKLYEQAHIDYVKDLWSKYETSELTTDTVDAHGNIIKGDIPADLWNETGWDRFVKRDEQGNVIGILSDDEIRNLMFDKDGNLTLQGVDIYDMIENDLSSRGYKSFGSYLAEQDEANKTNLVEWATSYNPYDYNGALTNAESFKELMGMSSTDDKYLFIERFGGMSEEDINRVIGNFDEHIANIDNAINSIQDANASSVKSAINEMLDDMDKTFEKYGISDSGIQKYKDVLNRDFEDLARNKDSLDYYDVQTAVAASAAIAGGTVGGAAIGSSIPVIGTLVGGLIGATAGYAAALEIKESREPGRQAYNEAAKESATFAKDATLNMLTYLSMNMKKTQRERQQDIYQVFSK